MTSRYTFGGDEHILVEISEDMRLESFFRSLAVTQAIRDRALEGVTEVQPSNASYQVKFDPDVIHPETMMETLKKLEAEVESEVGVLNTRIVEMPVYYQDPWTHDAVMQNRNRHQDPNATDLEYGAALNGYDSVEAFIEAQHSSPWMVTMTGFVTGVPWLFQLVARDKQIQVPKYLSPRTFTPKLTIGYGGSFIAIYSVQGGGGYQMFGITPVEIWDPTEQTPYFKGRKVFFKPGDIVKWKPIGREEYDRCRAEVEAGTYAPKIVGEFTFNLDDFNADIDGYNQKIMEALNVG